MKPHPKTNLEYVQRMQELEAKIEELLKDEHPCVATNVLEEVLSKTTLVGMLPPQGVLDRFGETLSYHYNLYVTAQANGEDYLTALKKENEDGLDHAKRHTVDLDHRHVNESSKGETIH